MNINNISYNTCMFLFNGLIILFSDPNYSRRFPTPKSAVSGKVYKDPEESQTPRN